MASAFGHAIASLALSQSGVMQKTSWKLLLTGIILSILPDADSIGFVLGVPYSSFWGHRGFSHSIVFAILISIICMLPFTRGQSLIERFRVFFFFFLSTLSHSVLDAMTTGGLGVAFFSPFDNHRYFFPFRPIKVSPISIKTFFSESAMVVLISEAIWIGIPAVAICVWSWLIKLLNRYTN